MMKERAEVQLPTAASTPAQPHAGTLDLSLLAPEVARPIEVTPAWWHRVRVGKLVLFVASLFLFTLAIALMKDGARGLAPLVQTLFSVNSAANSLGFGWLFAYTIMSGSPVAAAALTFFDAGVVDQLGAYAMITGSRLGASLVVLMIGFLYVLRGRNRATSLSMGLLSLSVTATTYLPALVLGSYFLSAGVLDSLQLRSGAVINSLFDVVIEPIVGVITSLLPEWVVFLVGLGVILCSFNLFDKCLPQRAVKESQLGWMSRLVYRPWVMFALGALITSISMSVSLSLSILVPLSARGFVRRENVIPYIMGANITTFIDTVLAAVLLKNPTAFTIVFCGMVSIAIVSVLVLALVYGRYMRAILAFVGWATANNRNLAIFMAAIFVVPFILMLI